MLKLRFTVHDVAWQFNNLAYGSGLMFVWPGQLLLGHYSVRIDYQREQNYTEIVLKRAFLNHTFTFCSIGLLDKSCM